MNDPVAKTQQENTLETIFPPHPHDDWWYDDYYEAYDYDEAVEKDWGLHDELLDEGGRWDDDEWGDYDDWDEYAHLYENDRSRLSGLECQDRELYLAFLVSGDDAWDEYAELSRYTGMKRHVIQRKAEFRERFFEGRHGRRWRRRWHDSHRANRQVRQHQREVLLREHALILDLEIENHAIYILQVPRSVFWELE